MAAPAQDDVAPEQSGNDVTPEETEGTVTPTGETADPAPAPEASTDDATAAPEADAGVDPDSSATTVGGVTVDQTVDPDNGAAGGEDPDGGAAPVFPTPSGPEGTDGDPLTTN